MLIGLDVCFIATRKEIFKGKEIIVVNKPRISFDEEEIKGKTQRADSYWEKQALEKYKAKNREWNTYKIHSFKVEKKVRLTTPVD